MVPSRRSLAAIALAALLVLAGCSGLSVTDQQSPGPETTVENFSYPQGWSQDGITDPATAERTHRDTVRNVSRRVRFVRGDDEENRTVVRTVDVDAGTGSLRWTDTIFGSTYVYYSSEGVFEYDPESGEVEPQRGENWTTADVADVEEFGSPLRALELNATETVFVEGKTAVRYNVTGIADSDAVPANDATGNVTVSEAGFIASYNVTRGNDGFTKRATYDVSSFGNATVTRPSWMPEK